MNLCFERDVLVPLRQGGEVLIGCCHSLLVPKSGLLVVVAQHRVRHVLDPLGDVEGAQGWSLRQLDGLHQLEEQHQSIEAESRGAESLHAGLHHLHLQAEIEVPVLRRAVLQRVDEVVGAASLVKLVARLRPGFGAGDHGTKEVHDPLPGRVAALEEKLREPVGLLNNILHHMPEGILRSVDRLALLTGDPGEMQLLRGPALVLVQPVLIHRRWGEQEPQDALGLQHEAQASLRAGPRRGRGEKHGQLCEHVGQGALGLLVHLQDPEQGADRGGGHIVHVSLAGTDLRADGLHHRAEEARHRIGVILLALQRHDHQHFRVDVTVGDSGNKLHGLLVACAQLGSPVHLRELNAQQRVVPQHLLDVRREHLVFIRDLPVPSLLAPLVSLPAVLQHGSARPTEL
mmetsp:Transcript_31951/g.82798  ORF Transcript_31951/g.82798 Transcript_31951/m.82798 type:complete len:401 (+) Transcript_31951:1724-2926(+)